MIPYTDENRTKIVLVAEYLNGTCKSVDDGLQQEFGEDVDLLDMDSDLLRELDELVRLCEGCGWWCDSGDVNDDSVCTECSPNGDDDD